MTLRAFSIDDAPTILSWIKTKDDFRKWSADRYPSYPAKAEDMAAQYDSTNIYPLTAVDDRGKIVGHIMIRIPNTNEPQSVRLGFVIVDNSLRGKGYGKAIVLNAIDYAHASLGATKISLGVFLNNPAAKHCYEAAGFETVGKEFYSIDGEVWEGVEMVKVNHK